MIGKLFRKKEIVKQESKKYSFTYYELEKIVNDAYIQGAIDFNDRNMGNAFGKLWSKIKNNYNVL
jgi:hypothetical protein